MSPKKKQGKNQTSTALRNDQIVLMSLMPGEDGKTMTHEAIAEEFGLTRQAVSMVLRSDEAREFVQLAREKFRESLFVTIEDELDLMSRLALKKLKVTLQAEISAFHKAKPNQDRVAMKLLEGRGFLKVAPEEEGAGGLRVSPDQFSKLLGALERSDRVKEIDPFENVRDAEFVLKGRPGSEGGPMQQTQQTQQTQQAQQALPAKPLNPSREEPKQEVGTPRISRSRVNVRVDEDVDGTGTDG